MTNTSTTPRLPFGRITVVAAAAAVAVFAMVTWRAGPDASVAVDDPLVHVEVPIEERGEPIDYSGATIDGRPLSFADLRGQVVVVNVWGSWCAPCRSEAPALTRVAADTADQGVRFVGINVKDNPTAARAFEKNFGITYPSVDGSDGRALLAFATDIPPSAVPTTVVLDREGRPAARVIGEVSETTLRSLLEPVVAEASA